MTGECMDEVGSHKCINLLIIGQLWMFIWLKFNKGFSVGIWPTNLFVHCLWKQSVMEHWNAVETGEIATKPHPKNTDKLFHGPAITAFHNHVTPNKDFWKSVQVLQPASNKSTLHQSPKSNAKDYSL